MEDTLLYFIEKHSEEIITTILIIFGGMIVISFIIFCFSLIPEPYSSEKTMVEQIVIDIERCRSQGFIPEYESKYGDIKFSCNK